jgi:predicted RNA-binding protein YlxR (DUF448 family)
MDDRDAALDAGVAEADGSGPLRRCIVTGESLPVERMIRFVIGPDGSVVPDLEAKLPGRGMWLSARRDVMATALAKNAFARAARRAVTVPADLADRIEALLARRCVEFLGLARRAGQIEAGFDQVRAALAKAPRGVLVEAADGAEDGRGKLRALAPQLPMVDVLSGEELGAAFARERFVHILLAPGRLADRLQAEAERLSGFRTANTATGHASGRH